MASRKPLFQVDTQSFREAIRPSLVGRLGEIEPRIALRAASELDAFLVKVIDETMRATTLNDKDGVIAKQLRDSARVYGRSSLRSLRGILYAYPWLFAHEYGAHIVPKEGQFLAIPIFYGLRPDGRPIFRNARSWNRFGSFVYTQRETGKKFLAYRSGGELRILYILIPYADIKPRLRLNITAQTLLPSLFRAWGTIYIEEASKSGVINLWGARP